MLADIIRTGKYCIFFFLSVNLDALNALLYYTIGVLHVNNC